MKAEKLAAILIIDDDTDVQRAAKFALARAAERIETLSSLQNLSAVLTPDAFDAVLLDMNFVLGDRSGRDGLDGLAQIAAIDPALSVVLTTSFGAVSLAVEALKRGAADFILKPWRNDVLVEAIGSAGLRTKKLRSGDTLDLDAMERAAIEKALMRHGGNIAQAAAALGLSRPALYRRMSKHGF